MLQLKFSYKELFNHHLHMLLIRYTRACSTYDQFLIRGSLRTNMLISQGLRQSHLQATFFQFYDRYIDLVCQYNLSLGQMLSDVFHTF
jgi:hypothetical protein